jgi:hypothetical protein
LLICYLCLSTTYGIKQNGKLILEDKRKVGKHLVITYILTYLHTPQSRVLLEKLTSVQLVKEFPVFYKTRKFITAATSAPTCSNPEPARSSPYPHIPLPKIYLNIILPSTPGSFKWSPFSGFPAKTLYIPLSFPYALHVPPISFFSILSSAQ